MSLIVKFSNYKTNTICVVALFAMAFITGWLSGIFRYTDYRWIYNICWPACFILHFISVLTSFVNLLYILRGVDFKDYKKYYWLAVNCIPLYFWIWLGFSITHP
jgi:hypothetical protein